MVGTRSSGIVTSAVDVLGMSVVRGMTGVGGVCEMCMCGRRGGERMRGLGYGFNNPVGTRGVLDVCLSCGGVGGVCGEWVGGLGPGYGWVGWCYVCVRCESGFSV